MAELENVKVNEPAEDLSEILDEYNDKKEIIFVPDMTIPQVFDCIKNIIIGEWI